MTSKSEKDRTKQIQDKCQSLLNTMLKDEDNKYCVDCDAKGPRWASWNLGVFLCIRCAGIHRKLGVHISKVKSVNLDSWTPEQVVSLQHMGNSRARAVYEANLPDNFRRPQSDITLESFIQSKYEHRKYLAREWVPPPLPKVDWEKEIDEDIERQKRRKKTILEKKQQISSVEIPQLPKPKSSSPKPSRSSPSPSSFTTDQYSKPSADLLGLQNGDESFSSFVSASTNNVPEGNLKSTESDSLQTEEESFFNQTVPTEQEKVKLTKDSILALYANAPTNTFNPNFINQTQGSFGINQHCYQGSIGYPQPQQNLQMQNNPQQYSHTNQFQQFPGQISYQNQVGQFSLGNQFQTPQTNIQYGSQPQNFPLVNGTNFYANSQIPTAIPNNSGPVNQFNLQPSGYVGQTAVANPFFGNAMTNVQQQLGNMTLNSTSANPGPTVSTNLWQ